MVNGASKADYEYDYQGRRTVKKLYQPNGPGGWTLWNTITYAYDGDQLLAEFQQTPLESAPRILQSFAWGPRGMLLSVTLYDASGQPGNTYFALGNGDGDVTALMNANGDVVARYEFDASGKMLSGGEATSLGKYNPFRFGKMYYDDESGLYWSGTGYYSPELGIWLTPDSAETNAYAAFDANPVNKVLLTADPGGVAAPAMSRLGYAPDSYDSWDYWDDVASWTKDNISYGIAEIGVRGADDANAVVYWLSDGEIGTSKSFSGMGQMLDSGQTTFWRAEGSSLPFVNTGWGA